MLSTPHIRTKLLCIPCRGTCIAHSQHKPFSHSSFNELKR
uniref:Uncharacterized protein n=1 Tax=Arundo donax TaxID=35708 RepID=A0A0A8ZXW8_ARUDO